MITINLFFAGLVGLTHLDLFGARITDSGTNYLRSTCISQFHHNIRALFQEWKIYFYDIGITPLKSVKVLVHVVLHMRGNLFWNVENEQGILEVSKCEAISVLRRVVFIDELPFEDRFTCIFMGCFWHIHCHHIFYDQTSRTYSPWKYVGEDWLMLV